MRKQNKNIELVDSGFRLNGVPFFMYSGEIHYFRILRKDWKDRLQKAKKAGLNTVSFYIPWIWHEYKEGFFDFTGKTKPERDVIGFISLLKELGLYAGVRIGPVSHGEITMDGLPAWLINDYPEIRLRKKDGTMFPYPSLPSFMNPTFQDYIGKWYKKLIPVLKDHQINRGGNIISVQLDNEIGMVNWLSKAADYSHGTTLLYQKYLKEKYGGIEKLNDAYGLQYGSFGDVLQPDNDVNESEMMRYWDWMFFYQRYYALYYNSLAKRARTEGIQVPLIANIPQFYDYDTSGRGNQGLMTTSMFRDFAKLVPEVIFGGAYQMRRLNFENFHDIGLVTEMVKMITNPGIPSICAELQVGIMSDRPRLYSQDVELNIKTSMAHGLSGLNGYLFCGGVNPKGMGGRGTYHEWQAPISATGKEKLHLEPIRIVGKFIKNFGHYLAVTKKQSDAVIGIYSPYYATEFLNGNLINDISNARDRLFFDGTARLLQLAGINFSFLDLQNATQEELSRIPCLWTFTLDFMDLDTQEKLVKYVEDGGNLVVNPFCPTRGLDLKPELFLINRFGLKILKQSFCNMVLRGGMEYMSGEGKMTTFDSEGCKVVTKNADGEACSVLKKIKKGHVLVIGFGMAHVFDYQIDMVREYAELMGVNPSVTTNPVDVHCVIRKTDKFGFMFLSNYHDEPREVFVELVLPGDIKKTRAPSAGKIKLPNRSSWILPLGVTVTNEISIKYATVEVLEYKNEKNKLSLTFHGASNGCAEVLLDMKKPKEIKLNKKSALFKYQNGICKIEFIANGQEEELLIKY